jgi:hypothetical protein
MIIIENFAVQKWHGLHVLVWPRLEPVVGLVDEEEEGEERRCDEDQKTF